MTVNQTSLLLQFSEKRLRPHLYTPTFQLVDLREDHSNRPEEETPKITKADIQQLVSWIKNQDLMIHTYWLDLKGWRAEQANGTPCLPRDTKRAANNRLANTGQNNHNHGGSPQKYYQTPSRLPASPQHGSSSHCIVAIKMNMITSPKGTENNSKGSKQRLLVDRALKPGRPTWALPSTTRTQYPTNGYWGALPCIRLIVCQ